MPGQNYVVTDAAGERKLFANVGNPKSFLAAMAKAGKTAVLATVDDMRAAGAVDDKGQELKAFASFRVADMSNRSEGPVEEEPEVVHWLTSGARTSGGAARAHVPNVPAPKRKNTAALKAAVDQTNARDASATANRQREEKTITAPTAAAPRKTSLRGVMDKILGTAR